MSDLGAVELQRRRIASERASAPRKDLGGDLFAAQVCGIDRVHSPAIGQIGKTLPAHLFPALVRDDVRHVQRIARLPAHPLSKRLVMYQQRRVVTPGS